MMMMMAIAIFQWRLFLCHLLNAKGPCSDGHTTSNDLVEMKVSMFSSEYIDDDVDCDLPMAVVPKSLVEERFVFVASNTTDPSL